MTDCSNAEVRDLLPDYVHDQLSVADLARVKQHLVSCADCAEELELLQTVLAIRPNVRTPNIADIVANLPKPGQLTLVDIDRPRVVAVDGVRDIASARSVAAKSVRKSNGFRNWRAIAAVAVMGVSVFSVKAARDSFMREQLPLADSATVADLPMRASSATAVNAQDSAANAMLSRSRVAISVGDPSEYSQEELAAMMARLDKWDGSVSADPLPGVSILPPGS